MIGVHCMKGFVSFVWLCHRHKQICSPDIHFESQDLIKRRPWNFTVFNDAATQYSWYRDTCWCNRTAWSRRQGGFKGVCSTPPLLNAKDFIHRPATQLENHRCPNGFGYSYAPPFVHAWVVLVYQARPSVTLQKSERKVRDGLADVINIHSSQLV